MLQRDAGVDGSDEPELFHRFQISACASSPLLSSSIDRISVSLFPTDPRRRLFDPKMGVSSKTNTDGDTESSPFLPPPAASPTIQVPHDSYNLAYIVYFTLGTGYLLPWNAFITAVDYFAYLYPDISVDRIFAVVYMVIGLVCLLLVVFYAHVSDAYVRINVGLAVFLVTLLVVPVMDVVYIKGQVGLYSGFYVTIGAVAVSGVADALVQGGIVGNAGELPERYMQATVAGTAASGKLFNLHSSDSPLLLVLLGVW